MTKEQRLALRRVGIFKPDMTEKIEIWSSRVSTRLTPAEIKAACKVWRERFADRPQTFEDADIVEYVAPERLLGPFRVQTSEDGSVHLWFRHPDRQYAENDCGERIHAIFEKGETLPGSGMVVKRSHFTTMGPETKVKANYLLKMD